MRLEPDWLGRERLPGGFESPLPLAGGELLEWELATLQRFGCSDRDSLNRFFAQEQGRKTLLSHLESRRFRIGQPEESALLFLALQQASAEQLEPFFSEVRFYPRLVDHDCPDPPFGMAFRSSAGELRKSLESYSLPLEVARKRESLMLWKPYFQRLLHLLQETREDDWPFQRYPEGWSCATLDLVRSIEKSLDGEVLCAYPQRADSDFRRLLSAVKTAALQPSQLTGREVGFSRKLLVQQPKASGAPKPIPGEEVLQAVSRVLERLRTLSPEQGLEALPQGLPEVIACKVERACLGTLSELRDRGLLNSLDVLSDLAPMIVEGALEDPLWRRTYRAFSRHPRSLPFESLPWLQPSWRPPSESRALAAASMLVESWWTHFGHRKAPAKLNSQLQTLARWRGVSREDIIAQTARSLDLSIPLQACRTFIQEQQELPCSKPYTKLQRDKRIEEALQRITQYEQLLKGANSL